eukprot:1999935-Rhodomonas_salina.2
MSGTDVGRSSACLHACYAMSGTEIAYGAVPDSSVRGVFAGCSLLVRSRISTADVGRTVPLTWAYYYRCQ